MVEAATLQKAGKPASGGARAPLGCGSADRLRGSALFLRESKEESGAMAEVAPGPSLAAVGLDDVLHNGEAQAGTALFAGSDVYGLTDQ